VPTVDQLLEKNADVWRAATHHQFLDGVRDGSLAPYAFLRWLAQDYLFAADLLRFQARLLARAPRLAQAVLASGVVALDAELSWFERHARERGVELGGERLQPTEAYRACLERLDRGPYEPAMVALWALERAYLEAWQSARPGAPAFREVVEHWTVPAFGEYVAELQRAADSVLDNAEPILIERTFVEIAQLERAFWDMALAEEGR
jgi:formylaminopyrimidine deformylase / aminopyrimidine aminohydrolase